MLPYATTAMSATRGHSGPARTSFLGWQDTQSESNDLSTREGDLTLWTSTPVLRPAARRTVGTAAGPTRDETGSGQTTPDRIRWRTDWSLDSLPGDFWDDS